MVAILKRFLFFRCWFRFSLQIFFIVASCIIRTDLCTNTVTILCLTGTHAGNEHQTNDAELIVGTLLMGQKLPY